MRFYLLMPLFSLLLVVFQTTVLDLLFLGKIRLELSLIAVIYAGFYMDLVKGGLQSFALGFFLDATTSMIPGLYVFLYMVIFFVAKNVSYRVYSEGIAFIIMFTFLCAFSEGIVILLLYKVIFGVTIIQEAVSIYLPQALAVAAVGPAFFAAVRRIEGLLYERQEA